MKKKQKNLLTLIIRGTVVYRKRYMLLCIFLYMGHIQLAVDNKILYTIFSNTSLFDL